MVNPRKSEYIWIPDRIGGVYFFWVDSNILYIGSTYNFKSRLISHRNMILNYGVSHFSLIFLPSEPSMSQEYSVRREMEKKYIKIYQPPLNHYYK